MGGAHYGGTAVRGRTEKARLEKRTGLDAALARPDDLLLLLKAAVQQVDLQREGVLGHVRVEVLEVLVVDNRLEVDGPVGVWLVGGQQYNSSTVSSVQG